MNIDFIKWMVEKAEGFEIEEYFHNEEKHYYLHTPFVAGYNLRFLDTQPQEFHNSIMSLLLQRAIESVNREYWHNNKQFRIQQDHLGCQVFDKWGEQQTTYGLSKSPDRAKEAALEYVWEQTK